MDMQCRYIHVPSEKLLDRLSITSVMDDATAKSLLQPFWRDFESLTELCDMSDETLHTPEFAPAYEVNFEAFQSTIGNFYKQQPRAKPIGVYITSDCSCVMFG